MADGRDLLPSIQFPDEPGLPEGWKKLARQRRVDVADLACWMHGMRTADHARSIAAQEAQRALAYLLFDKTHSHMWRCTQCGSSTVPFLPDGKLLSCGCLVCVACLAGSTQMQKCSKHSMAYGSHAACTILPEVAVRTAEVAAASMVLRCKTEEQLAATVEDIRTRVADVDSAALGSFQALIKSATPSADELRGKATDVLKGQRAYLSERCNLLLSNQARVGEDAFTEFPKTPFGTQDRAPRNDLERPFKRERSEHQRDAGVGPSHAGKKKIACPPDLVPDMPLNARAALPSGGMRVQNRTVFLSKFDGRCQCGRPKTSGQTLMAFVGEGDSKKCVCTMCAFEPTNTYTSALCYEIATGKAQDPHPNGPSGQPAGQPAGQPRSKKSTWSAEEQAEAQAAADAFTLDSDDVAGNFDI